MVTAAGQFALPQIRIVNPKLVICLGLASFNALRQVCGVSKTQPFELEIESPFNIVTTRVWCQAHTGARGQNNRNKGGVDRVSEDWLRMKEDFNANSSVALLLADKKRPSQAARSRIVRGMIR
jgi:uracil-DNA glycosylase